MRLATGRHPIPKHGSRPGDPEIVRQVGAAAIKRQKMQLCDQRELSLHLPAASPEHVPVISIWAGGE